jgi:hypothetical protein
VTRAEAPAAAFGDGHLRFALSVRFTKGEAFDACQALADADRILCRSGGHAEAAALADLFELFEQRLVCDGSEFLGRSGSTDPPQGTQP